MRQRQHAEALRRRLAAPRASAAQLTVGLLIDTRSAAAAAAAAAAAPVGPLSSALDCTPGQPPHMLTPREMDMQQQRRCAVAGAGGRPPGGYVALCLAIKSKQRTGWPLRPPSGTPTLHMCDERAARLAGPAAGVTVPDFPVCCPVVAGVLVRCRHACPIPPRVSTTCRSAL